MENNNLENVSISYLNGLIKQKRNLDFKSTLLGADWSQFDNLEMKTLMHTAAATSNIEIIGTLFGLGFDINALNAQGQTPLHFAVLNKNFQVVQLLLALDANILIFDFKGISTLDLCFWKEYQVPKYIVTCFLARLKRTNISSQDKADLLKRAGCSLNQALDIHDAELTGRLLDWENTITDKESNALLKRAMDSGYPENVRALVQRGPALEIRRNNFLRKLLIHKNEPKMKFYIDRVIEWDAVTIEFINAAVHAFQHGSEHDVQFYLNIGMDDYIRKRCGWELLVGLFGNKLVDCLKIIKNRNFNVNSLDRDGSSALHLAFASKKKAAIIYLLDHGANPNIRDDSGRIPLLTRMESKWNAIDSTFIDLLLEAGSDLQNVDKNGKGIFDDEYGMYKSRVAAELCILEAKGLLKLSLEDSYQTVFHEVHKITKYRLDLAWMKTRKISKSFTLFEVLAGEVANTARYVKNKKDVTTILKVSRERELTYVYAELIKKNLKQSLIVNKLRPKAAEFLANVMKIQRNHLVIESVIRLLTYRDLAILNNTLTEP